MMYGSREPSFLSDPASLQCAARHIRSHEVVAVTKERAYILPHPGLRDVISHYTLYFPSEKAESPHEPEALHIVPDASGCIVCRITEGDIQTRLWGPSSRLTTVERTPRDVLAYIMVEFPPGGAGRLFNVPLHPLLNETMPLDAFDPRLARAIVELVDSFRGGSGGRGPDTGGPGWLDALLQRFDQVFMKLCSRTERTGLARQIIGDVLRANGALRVGDLSARTGYSQRHLNRIAAETVGMSVKLLARVMRINAACSLLAESGASLTDTAHRLNYHDQPHFIHDFKEICGVTPGAYLQAMSGFYNEELKLAAM